MEIDFSKQEYCRALLCIENGKEKYCGDIIMGKKRYCARHSRNNSSNTGSGKQGVENA